MISNLQMIAIYVRDMARAVEFYQGRSRNPYRITGTD